METMERDLLQAVRPNIVQAIRAFRVEDLLAAAEQAGHHFLYANLADAQNKQDVLDMLAEHFLLASHFGKNMDALYDCMTDSVHKAGPQRGFVVVVGRSPTAAASTVRPASSCWTCSATPPTTGTTERCRSVASPSP